MLNHIIVMGRLTRDPELRYTQSGTPVASFTVAVDRDFGSRDGGEKQTDFIDCTCFNKTAALVDKYFHKGDGIMVEGRIEQDKYVDKDGNNRTSWKIVCDRIEFPPSRKGQSDAAPAQSAAFADEDDDGEIPF